MWWIFLTLSDFEVVIHFIFYKFLMDICNECVQKSIYEIAIYLWNEIYNDFGNIKNYPVGLYVSGLLKNEIKDFFGMDFFGLMEALASLNQQMETNV